MKLEFGYQIYADLKLVGFLGTTLAVKAWKNEWSSKVECV